MGRREWSLQCRGGKLLLPKRAAECHERNRPVLSPLPLSCFYSKGPSLQVTGIGEAQSILPLSLTCSLQKAAVSFQIGSVKPVVIFYVMMLTLL